MKQIKSNKSKIRKIAAAWTLIAALLVSLVSPAVVYASEGAQAESQELSEYETVLVDSVEDLIELAQLCHEDAWSANKIVRLTADIDVLGSEFQYIPVFKGIFDGDGHTISGFQYKDEGYVVGFFRYIEEAGVVENLTLKGSVISTDEKQCIGGLCGMNRGTIRNCTFQGTVDGKRETGGIAGINESNAQILRCTVKGRIKGYYYTGGVTGKNYGTVDNCTNYANVNDNSEWVETDDELSVGFLQDIRENDTDIKLESGVDTGGIAGFSKGIIIRCTNNGRIGYEHTGYNVGGIVGRQSGVVSSSTNHGTVYGRKDIGGIVGQMEPDIEVNEAQSVREAINKLHDAIEQTVNDMQTGKDSVKAQADVLKAYSDAALESGNQVADQLSSFADENIDEVNVATQRLEQVFDMLPDIIENSKAAGNSMTDVNQMLKKLNEDLRLAMQGQLQGDELESAIQEALDKITDSSENLEEQITQIFDTLEAMENLLLDEHNQLREWADFTMQEKEELVTLVLDLAKELSEAGIKEADILSALAVIAQKGSSYLQNTATVAYQDLQAATEHVQNVIDSLQQAGNGLGGITNYLNAQDSLQFSKLGAEYDQQVDSLHNQLKGITDSISSISEQASSCTDVVNADLRAVNSQLNIVLGLFLDRVEEISNPDLSNYYADVSDEEIDAAENGRVDYCTNKGVVSGDIDVGGITGSMAIDDEDPEENAAGSADHALGNRYTTKCIINKSTNEGYITAKKDGAGGIVGYMNHGVVVDCQAYGLVESTEGDYVGGICGQSLSLIRRSYALCSIAGKRNVGGIAGYGSTITDCCAMVKISEALGRFGAIAGQVQVQEGDSEQTQQVSNNFYVEDDMFGIDNISYQGVAEPLTYEELLTITGLPTKFWHLTVTFKIEDTYLGTQELAYGDSLEKLVFPEIPQKEGYYGVWPDVSGDVMTGNLVVEGEYKETVKVVEGGDTDAEKPLALMESAFTEDTVLHASQSDVVPPQELVEGKQYQVYDISLENSNKSAIDQTALRLYNPYDNAVVYCLQDTWQSVETKVRGHYLQVDMIGTSQTFCIVEVKKEIPWAVIGAVTLVIALGIIGKLMLGRRKKRRNQKLKKELDENPKEE